MDEQSFGGKIVGELVRRGAAAGVPVCAVVGVSRLSAQEAAAAGCPRSAGVDARGDRGGRPGARRGRCVRVTPSAMSSRSITAAGRLIAGAPAAARGPEGAWRETLRTNGKPPRSRLAGPAGPAARADTQTASPLMTQFDHAIRGPCSEQRGALLGHGESLTSLEHAQQRVSQSAAPACPRGGASIREPADVAQLVEHFTRNEGVSGSNPLVGSAHSPR